MRFYTNKQNFLSKSCRNHIIRQFGESEFSNLEVQRGCLLIPEIIYVVNYGHSEQIHQSLITLLKKKRNFSSINFIFCENSLLACFVSSFNFEILNEKTLFLLKYVMLRLETFYKLQKWIINFVVVLRKCFLSRERAVGSETRKRPPWQSFLPKSLTIRFSICILSFCFQNRLF